MVEPVILAAGASARMGRPKALLVGADGRTFVSRIADTFASAGLRRITIVTGCDHASVVNAVAADPPRGLEIRFARNPEPARGQLSSVLTGLDSVDRPGVEAMLLTLVDVPSISPAAVAAVLTAYRRTGGPIVRPAIGERHGHPVLFDRRLFDELRSADPEAGAKTVVRRHAALIVNVPVEDEGCLSDIDTPAEYAALLERG